MTADILQLIPIKTIRPSEYSRCNTCEHVFNYGEYRFKWRLTLPTSYKYLRGQFWTLQCKECFTVTREEWIKALKSVNTTGF